jgi:hypothetical protein
MPSKFDRLRAGEVVEMRPGRKARLNFEDKTYETSDGKKIYVGDDPDFFPKNEEQLQFSKEKEDLERDIARKPLGEFTYQFANKGIAGGAKDWLNKITKTGDDYLRSKKVNQNVSESIAERSPWVSGAATAASFIPDIALTKGMSAVKAAPLLTALHAGPRIVEEPQQVAGEALVSAAGGKIIDFGANALGKIAQRRQLNRSVKGLAQETEAANVAEMSRAKSGTEAEKLRFAKDVENRNKELQKIARLQQTENEAFKSATENSFSPLVKFTNKTPLSNEIMAVEDFIQDAINTSPVAATSEANYVSRFLKSIFKGDKNGKLTQESIKKGINSLDEAIIRNEGIKKELLGQYKTFISEQLPERISSAHIFEKWIPKIAKPAETIEDSLIKTLNSSPEIHSTLGNSLGINYTRNLSNDVKKVIKDILSKYRNDIKNLDPEVLRQEIIEGIKGSSTYEKIMGKVDSLFPQLSKNDAFKAIPEYRKIHEVLERYPDIVSDRISKSLDRYIPDMNLDFARANEFTKKSIGNLSSLPNVINPPPEVTPPSVVNPNLRNIPTLPSPSGLSEKLGDTLEKPLFQGKANMNNLLKIGALKYTLGKAALPLEAGAAGAYGAAKLLTSPSAAGEAARISFKQGGIQAIDSLARKYPSYHDGIIENPQERRSLNKEIEDDPEIPIEEKAILQSKINRGKSIYQRL